MKIVEFNEPEYFATLSEEEKHYALLAEKCFWLANGEEYSDFQQFMHSLSLNEIRGLADDAARRAAYYGRMARGVGVN